MKILFFLVVISAFAYGLKEIDDEMQELVYQLRDNLESKAKSSKNDYLREWTEKSSDGILVNWIINSEKNLQKAENDILAHMKWRKDHDIDNVKTWKYTEKEENNTPFSITGHDKNGDVVLYVPFGTWEVRKLLGEGVRVPKLVLSFVRAYEWAMQTPDPKTDILPDNFVFLVDFDKFSVSQITSIRSISVAVQFAITYMTRFPMYAITTVLFRDPPYFQVMWGPCKAVIPERALKRFTLTGTDEKVWKKALNDRAPPEAIPDFLGGKAKVNYITHGNDNTDD